MKRENIITVISFLLALLFSYAAASKMLAFQKFQVELGQSTMLGFLAVPLSFFVPAFEILLAITLFIPACRLIAYYMSFSMMVVFTTYIIIIMNYSFYVPCSCGGILQRLGWQEHLVFNVFFVCLTIVGILLLESKRKEEGGAVVSMS